MSKPVVVIRKLEDSPDWLDRRLVGAYLSTQYRAEVGQSLHLRIGQKLPTATSRFFNEKNISTLAVVSAWNPASIRLAEAENQSRNEKLERKLQKTARLFLPGFNVSNAGDWLPEESFWAVDIMAQEAVRLGKFFGQNAIVWWEKMEVPELWWLL